MTCLHENFTARVDVNRITEDDEVTLAGFYADVRVWCADCDETFVFHGGNLPIGLLPDRPCISVDGAELRVPLRPQSSDPHYGMGLPGFIARVHEGGRGAAN